jgi:hypothetical protein
MVSLVGAAFSYGSSLWALDAQLALNAHNLVRQTVSQGGYAGQPLPTPALAWMFWDPELAAAAATYAGQCVWAHSSDRVNTGENLYASTSLSSDIEDAVAAWADEQRYFNLSTNSCTTGYQCGHYTQLVWQDSLLVGCGDAVCSPLRESNGTTLFSSGRYQVCRYATAGNIVGNRPYDTQGEDASLVPSFTETTGVLTIPYALVWHPNSVVESVRAEFRLLPGSPVRFEFSQAVGTTYLDRDQDRKSVV